MADVEGTCRIKGCEEPATVPLPEGWRKAFPKAGFCAVHDKAIRDRLDLPGEEAHAKEASQH